MIISLSGKIGSGKDTAALLIQKLFIDRKIELGEVPIHRSPTLEQCHMGCAIRGSGWEVKKFANKLKTFASAITGIDKSKFESQDFKKSQVPSEWFIKGELETYRDLLIRIGDGCRNVVHSSIWVLATFADYVPIPVSPTQLLHKQLPNWIITDVRYPNELEQIKQREGISIRLERDSSQKIDHYSETALDNSEFDYTIPNNGTIEDLYISLRELLVKEGLL